MNLLEFVAFRVFHAFPPAEGAEGLWRPPLDLYETATEVVVEIEIPGASPGALRIVSDGHTLLVEGSRETRASGSPDGRFLCLERASGPFRRFLDLPARVDRERAVARYRDGILTVTLPNSGRLGMCGRKRHKAFGESAPRQAPKPDAPPRYGLPAVRGPRAEERPAGFAGGRRLAERFSRERDRGAPDRQGGYGVPAGPKDRWGDRLGGGAPLRVD